MFENCLEEARAIYAPPKERDLHGPDDMVTAAMNLEFATPADIERVIVAELRPNR